tara:strand:+ start:326 stop:733 length:408 start_codon:yes stop_codon:yes gene_type:complete
MREIMDSHPKATKAIEQCTAVIEGRDEDGIDVLEVVDTARCQLGNLLAEIEQLKSKCTMVTRSAGIDECIKPLIEALNSQDHQTIASCCGHGYQPLRVSLKDGREILIMNYEQAQKVCGIFDGINGEPPTTKGAG